MIKNLFFSLLFITHPLLSAGILFLPGRAEGNLPSSLERVHDRSQEISKFGAFYANLLIRTKAETTERLRDRELFDKFRGTRFSIEDFAKVCADSTAEYLVRDELSFQNKISLDRTVYNCVQKRLEEIHLSDVSDPFFLMRSVTEKSFPFLPSKRRQNAHSNLLSKPRELIFIVDLSPSFQREREEWSTFVSNSSWGGRTGIRLVSFAEGKVSIFPKPKSMSEFRSQLGSLKSSGKSSLDDVSEALFRVKRTLFQSGNRSIDQEIILLTNAKGKIPNPTLSSAFQDLQSSGYRLSLFTAPYFSNSQIQFYKGILPKNSLFEISYFRRVSTDKDSKTIVFRGRQIYFTHSSVTPSENLSETSLNKVSYAGKYTESESINPLNFTEIYSELTGEKILGAEPLQNNLSYLLSQTLLKDQNRPEGIEVLIKSGEKAFWISLPKGIQPPAIEEKIAYQTTYVPSTSSIDGVVNLPDWTERYAQSPSQLLECTPTQVRNYFQNTNKSSFDCIVRGQVLEVKGL
ncbi:VWA domain-containing protein [Leptospira gomenensis]|uniref:VWA domain-containing protein n=1 Tax=Leptospira gomenensis TaxID=2484974 RepID=A0A5F1Y714_9LEPT|nr:VWA domain-containing protein [Leptospira gomenensis]TGK28016.1 VWA domain-containing protein [Leptospira gomenensis]TGK37129.1 VWA domain-containing protein [Leptospira gomenensis]TGK45765.1 VWA domain-containing protein [Leptospira gomenensis]TGK59704.1 VWA domain-containing protein [Leptospira gomenensis]